MRGRGGGGVGGGVLHLCGKSFAIILAGQSLLIREATLVGQSACPYPLPVLADGLQIVPGGIISMR